MRSEMLIVMRDSFTFFAGDIKDACCVGLVRFGPTNTATAIGGLSS